MSLVTVLGLLLNPDQVPENPAPEVPAPETKTDEDDPNNVHKQCERAAAEALRRAMALLRKRGLLPEEEPTEEEKKEEEQEVEKEDEKPAEPEPVPAPVNPLLQSVESKTEGDTQNGPLSWVKR